MESNEIKKIQQSFMEKFGSRDGHLAWQLMELSRSGQPCDITFTNRPPLIDTKISERMSIAMMYGAGPEKMRQLLSDVELADGKSVLFGEIWTIHPMPMKGFTADELATVDITEADEPSQFYGGKTLRDVINETYRPGDANLLDHYIRRFIAS